VPLPGARLRIHFPVIGLLAHLAAAPVHDRKLLVLNGCMPCEARFGSQ
jgi:hypothetical protein